MRSPTGDIDSRHREIRSSALRLHRVRGPRSAGRAVACTATGASVWPPLELPPGTTTPTGAAEITGLGTAPGTGGTTQVTHDGLPLYRFSKDKTAADATGEGLQSFGGIWHV